MMSSPRIGQYEVQGELGAGGIGQVFVAKDIDTGRQVAIKTLRPEFARDQRFLDRFLVEAQSMARLDHANIATLYHLHPDRQQPALIMEWVRGYTLAKIIERVRRLSLRDTQAILAQTIAGLSYAHREGIIHRDIKPDNLMVNERGQVKIMDFGISRIKGSRRLTHAGQNFGTPLYAPPEQIESGRGEIDERSDLYSLGIVTYEMLAGVPPFLSESEYEIQTAHLRTPPPPLTTRVRDLPTEVEAAIMKALAKQPDDRFASVDDFGRALGVTSVALESQEILKRLMATAFPNAPPPAPKPLPLPPGTRQRGAGGTRIAGTADEQSTVLALGGAAKSNGLRGPMLLLGAAVIGVAAVFGYLYLAPNNGPPQIKTADRGPSADLGPRTSPPEQQDQKQQAIGPKPLQQPNSTVMVPAPGPRPTPNPGSSGDGSTSNPGPPIPPISRPEPPPSPSPPPQPEPPSPPPPVVPQPPSPASRPYLGPVAFRGMFQDLADASIYVFNGKTVQLYGVVDPSPMNAQHKSAVLAAVHSMLNGKTLTCYAKGSEYQCFVDGNGDQDFAILLHGIGLVKYTSQEYTSLASH
jgi:serine/threonine protein kinase